MKYLKLMVGTWLVKKGSHKQYKHPFKKGIVTIPDHGKNEELEHFLVSSIFKQAGLK